MRRRNLITPVGRIAFCLALAVGLYAQVQAVTNSATATYQNPLLPVQMADPHVIEVDGTYYLYATTHGKGYDAYTSADLVNWTNRGSVYTDARGGIWAPDILDNRSRDGKFYLYYTASTQRPPRHPGDKVVGVAVASSPMGPFEDKGVLASDSIDGHLFAEKGKYYFYYVNLLDGFKIMVQRMSSPVKKDKGEPVQLITPTEPWERREGNVTEGPFILKRGSTYYLTYSGTGADSPFYSIGYATSKSPMGPFKKFGGNPIVTRHGKVLGPGHHCVVTGPDKQMWMVYHQKWSEEKSYSRFLALDRIWFDRDGVLKAEATREEPRPVPQKR